MMSLRIVFNFFSQSCLQNSAGDAGDEGAGDAGSLPVQYPGGAKKKKKKLFQH
jgi:hypothetical protein